MEPQALPPQPQAVPGRDTQGTRPSRRKIYAIVGVIAVLLIAGFVIADFVTRAIVENRIASRIKSENNVSAVDVSLGGVSMLVNLARGSVPSATITMGDLQSAGVTFDKVVLDLDDVSFSGTGGGDGEISGKSGRAAVTLTADELNDALGPAANVVGLSPTSEGVDVSIKVPIVGEITAGLSVDVDDGTLVLGLDDVAVSGFGVNLPSLPKVRVPLPFVPRSTNLDRINASHDAVTLEFSFGEFTLNSSGVVSSLRTLDPGRHTHADQALANPRPIPLP